jgi:hypothetical protein
MRPRPFALAATAALAASLSAASVAGAAPDESSQSDDGISTSVVVVPVRHRTKYVQTDSLLVGEQVVLAEGVDGRRRWTIVKVDGDIPVHLPVRTRVVRKPVTEVIAVGTGVPAPPPVAVDPVWDQLAECESGGDWDISTGNGYYGGLQFSASTWSGVGGTGLPHEHSREEQIRLATILRDQSGGYGPWPSCAAQLGLPR